MAIDYFGALGAFVQSAETRSFTKAGHRLGISSSAVGKAVIRLEQELGVRLFHRSTRTITLTAEGQMFLDRSRRMLDEFEAARSELAQAGAAPQGNLRVGLPLLGTYLMSHLLAFQLAFPDIALELRFGDRLVNVIDEGFDAVIRIGDLDDSRLTMRPLTRYQHHLVAAPAYLSRRGTPSRPFDLAAHSCLRYRYPTSGKLAPWPLLSRGRMFSMELPQSATADAIQPLQEMAEAGLGIALLPDFIIAEALAAGRLVKVLEKNIHDPRTVSVLWPSSRQSLPKIKTFVDFMAQRLGPV